VLVDVNSWCKKKKIRKKKEKEKKKWGKRKKEHRALERDGNKAIIAILIKK
jgi:hypothetical protein